MGDKFDDIAELLIPYEVLSFDGKRFKLYGLGLPEITFIARLHGDALGPIYQLAKTGQLEADATAIAMQLADDFGPILSTVIAVGMKRVEAIEIIQNLTFPVQIDALDKIIRLTLGNEGGAEKLMEIVTRALEAMAKQKLLKP